MDKNAAWVPTPWEDADAAAIRDLMQGKATPEQQQRAMTWIIEKSCRVYDFAFRPGGVEAERETHLLLGRQFVGQKILKWARKADKTPGDSHEQRTPD